MFTKLFIPLWLTIYKMYRLLPEVTFYGDNVPPTVIDCRINQLPPEKFVY